MKAIILAAGKGERLSPLTDNTPKCLLPFNGFTPIERLVNQVKCDKIVVLSYLGVQIHEKLKRRTDITFITKSEHKTNANRYSLLIALEHLQNKKEDVLIFEADMVAEDSLIDYVCGTDFENRTTWFTSGPFKPGMSGGIIGTDGKNKITNIRITDCYLKQWMYHKKMTGILRINKKDIKKFYNNLKLYCENHGPTGYYLDAFAEYLPKNPMYLGDISHYTYKTFNTKEDYYNAKQIIFDKNNIPKKKVETVLLKDLHPIEKHNPKRLYKIQCSKPIKIEGKHNLILDGHHRFHKAIKNGKKKIKVIKFDYSEVEMWSLREELKITKNDVIAKVLKDESLYPYKTVKHKFPKFKVVENER